MDKNVALYYNTAKNIFTIGKKAKNIFFTIRKIKKQRKSTTLSAEKKRILSRQKLQKSFRLRRNIRIIKKELFWTGKRLQIWKARFF